MSTVTDYQIISGEHDMVVRRVQELLREGYELHGDMQFAVVAAPPDSNGEICVESVFAQALVKVDRSADTSTWDALAEMNDLPKLRAEAAATP